METTETLLLCKLREDNFDNSIRNQISAPPFMKYLNVLSEDLLNNNGDRSDGLFLSYPPFHFVNSRLEEHLEHLEATEWDELHLIIMGLLGFCGESQRWNNQPRFTRIILNRFLHTLSILLKKIVKANSAFLSTLGPHLPTFGTLLSISRLPLKHGDTSSGQFWIICMKRLNKIVFLPDGDGSGCLRETDQKVWLDWILCDAVAFVCKSSDHFIWYKFLSLLKHIVQQQGCSFCTSESSFSSLAKESRRLVKMHYHLQQQQQTFPLDLFKHGPDHHPFVKQHLKMHILLMLETILAAGKSGVIQTVFDLVDDIVADLKEPLELASVLEIFSSDDDDLIRLLSVNQQIWTTKGIKKVLDCRYGSHSQLQMDPKLQCPISCFQGFLDCIAWDLDTVIEFLMDHIDFVSYLSEFLKYLALEIMSNSYQDEDGVLDFLLQLKIRLGSYVGKNIFPYNPEYLVRKITSILDNRPCQPLLSTK